MNQLPTPSPALAQRLEGAEATANAAFVAARHRVEPHVGAGCIDVAGVRAMFDGVGSPITQTFGLGLFAPFLNPQFAAVEEFFATHGSTTSHEVSSFAAEESVRLLPARGYVPVEHSTVLLRSTHEPAAPVAGSIRVRITNERDVAEWARISARGWSSEGAEVAAFVERFARVIGAASGVHCFVAELDGEAVAAAALHMAGDVALLAGASTVPEGRRQGAQQALLQARLAFAASHGVALAMVVTQPGSASQRNAERRGFRPVYTRTKWERAMTGATAS